MKFEASEVKGYVARLFFYVLGFFIFSFGSVLSIKSTLGVTATTSMPLALNAVTGLSVGTFMTIMAVVYVTAQILILRKDFKLINVFQIACGLMMGVFVDLVGYLLSGFTVNSYPGHFVLMIVSIPIISLGLSFIINMNFLPSPAEGFALAVAQRIGKPFPKVKVAVDCVTVVIAILIFVVGYGKVEGIREGTVLNAVFIGIVIGWYNRILKPFYTLINNLGHKEEPAYDAQPVSEK